MQIKTIIGFALITLFSFGCASIKSFKVDAIAANNSISGRTYHMIPANPQVPDNDLRFIEASGIIEKALSSRGYIRKSDSASADLIIALEYSVGQPETVTTSRPAEPIDPDFGFYHMVRVPVRNRMGGLCYVRTMVWSPDYAYMDRGDVITTTYYEKHLAMTAFTNDGSKDLPQLWSVVVMERDDSSDIRSLLPMMAVTAVKYAETDTKGQVSSRLDSQDPDVLRISPAKPEPMAK